MKAMPLERRTQKAINISETRYRRLFEAARDGILILDAVTGNILDVNPYLIEMLGYSKDEFLGKKLWEIGVFKDVLESKISFKELQEKEYIRYDDLPLEAKSGKSLEFEFVSNAYQEGDRKVIQCNIRDNSERKLIHVKELLTHDVLVLLNKSDANAEIIKDIVNVIKQSTGFEAVGIRLQDGCDFPYYETNGFPDSFVEKERYLCKRDNEGNLVKGENGNPVLECMCGNVISGRTNPELPFFTKGGSFWSNCTTDLLASTTEEERQLHTRNHCNGQGYESVALIPLRSDDKVIGLLQFNDHRKNRFNTKMIEFLEVIGTSIGIALARRKIEDALLISKNYLDKVINTTGDPIFVKDDKFRFTLVNDALCNMLGIARENIIGKTLGESLPEDQMDHFLKIDKMVLDSGQENICEEPLTRPDGIILTIVTRKTRFVNEQGNRFLVGLIHDITERKKSETEIMSWASIASESPNIIIRINRDGRIMYANESAYLLLPDWNIKAAAAAADSLPSEVRNAASEAMKTRLAKQHEFHHRDRIFLFDTAPVADTDYVNLYGHDITDQNKLEKEKKEIQGQLLQSQKMESIGTLAGGIAHDFNNLLTIIKGYSNISMKSLDKGNDLYNNFSEINIAVDRAAELTKQMLLFSRKQPMNTINLSLNRIMENMSKMLKRLIGEDIKIKTTLQTDLWNTNADESKIEQIIMNLAVNARDAMPKGGILTIKTENVTLNEEDSMKIIDAHPGKYVKLSIQDNGTGMNKEVVGRIFEPFFTTKGVGKGTGLGMPVVYGIVKQHNGWVNVYSEPGEGTIFKIYLPASFEKTEIKDKDKDKKTLAGHGERILIVEDEEGIRKYADRVLSMNDYVVFTAENVKEALELYEKEKGNFGLVLTDVILPDRTGIELVTQLLSGNPELKVIFTSGYLDDKSQWGMIKEKGHKFLQKPFELNELLAAVKEVLEKK